MSRVRKPPGSRYQPPTTALSHIQTPKYCPGKQWLGPGCWYSACWLDNHLKSARHRGPKNFIGTCSVEFLSLGACQSGLKALKLEHGRQDSPNLWLSTPCKILHPPKTDEPLIGTSTWCPPLGFSPSPTCLRNGRVFLPSKSTKASENTSTPTSFHEA